MLDSPISNPPTPTEGTWEEEQDGLRVLSRSPHPYHHDVDHDVHDVHRELLEPPDLAPVKGVPDQLTVLFGRESTTPISDSGTEADDEHFLKRLPAPRTTLHKGLRGKNESLSGYSTPALTPTSLGDEGHPELGHAQLEHHRVPRRGAAETERRQKEVIRRSTEVLLLLLQGGLIWSNPHARPFLLRYRREFFAWAALVAALLILLPPRLVFWAYRHARPSRAIPISVPVAFDPAPTLYPPLIPVFVSLLTAAHTRAVVLPNLVLSICALPRFLVPFIAPEEALNCLHWLLSCVPLFAFEHGGAASLHADQVPREVMVLMYPLHQSLCLILQHLTTTSLLPAELQLLSTSLVNILLLAHSPQAVVLKALLWGGGLSVIILCGHAICWAIALARVPKWRFKRLPLEAGGLFSLRALSHGLTAARSRERRDAFAGELDPSAAASGLSSDDNAENQDSKALRVFFSLTQQQATRRKWLYALYVHVCILAIVLLGIRAYVQRYALADNEPVGWALGYLFGDLPWFRFQVVKASLQRWILLPPRSGPEAVDACAAGAWLQHLRHHVLGDANTRLALCAYYVAVIGAGLAVVFRLSPVYEVDTRRKVFHFMMVAMFLPSVFVDPAFVALALALMLAIFLLLDLLRASQLPPLSKPIAAFLTPYVDGRDLRGPVVISHIFLLIGCAIPLWLSLAALPRAASQVGDAATPPDGIEDGAVDVTTAPGWELSTRDVSMVAGIVCVGLGDAAASLIGRRWGHRKWLWGGGKSLEGSLAFAVAVFAGLMAASAWLRVGGWSRTSAADADGCGGPAGEGRAARAASWAGAARDTAVCASLASLTEAVLTGGNDNVVVPVVLWMCVKASGL
ncbi:hypothetical protein P8C59_006615 [Phyllachora maydis]|uniref:dolichol kinase n=1 Tax=Phyllachora maydis TaxID=1825666 RepID=A0AAD9I8G4_9PEZI|nr:hypothetical protein P8C59_006615 [Phyllachora maydis]